MDSFSPELPPLFDHFRERRTRGQRRRRAIRTVDVGRQRILVLGVRVKRRVMR
jgi:hypothetical protein